MHSTLELEKESTLLKVDGIMGPHTIQNLQLFLNKNADCVKALLPDGVMGPKSKSAICGSAEEFGME